MFWGLGSRSVRRSDENRSPSGFRTDSTLSELAVAPHDFERVQGH